MPAENWLAIEGYEGRYAVSDQGNVMSMNFAKSGLPGLLKFNLSRGYQTVELQTGPVKKRFTVHRLVAGAFIGPRPEGMQINHIDGVKANNAASNLEYVTPSENQKHSFRIGLQSLRGEKHTRAKLTDEAICDIRARCASGETQTAVAKFYGVSQSAINLVVRRKRWAHIEKSEIIQ
jgi:hypothetical protein